VAAPHAREVGDLRFDSPAALSRTPPASRSKISQPSSRSKSWIFRLSADGVRLTPSAVLRIDPVLAIAAI
jgi:hypothetical protein